ncbi:MAG: MFS transporter [Chloroflexi bacterium]|nr:MFS transporter [Chloroflexota bacterium]
MADHPAWRLVRATRARLVALDAAESPLERANVRMLTGDTAIQGIIQAGIGTFITVFLVRLDSPNWLVGLVASLPALGAVLISLPASRWAAAWSDPVRTVVTTRLWIRLTYLAIAVVPSLLTGLAASYAIAFFWGLHSLPAAITSLAWTAVVAEVIAPARRPLVNGVRWALLSVVTAVASALFGVLLDLIVFPLNYQIVFVISFVAGLVTLYTFSRLRMPTAGTPVAPPRVALGLLDLPRHLRREPAFSRYMVASFVYRFGLYLPVAVMPIFWVTELQASDTIIGLRTTAGHGMLVVSYLLWGYLAVRRGNRLVLLVSSAGLCLYPIATAVLTDAVWLVPVALLWGLFVSGIDVAFFEALLHTTPLDRRAVFIAIDSTVANAAVFVAPLLGSVLGDAIGLRPALLLSGVLSLLGTLLLTSLNVAKTPVEVGARQVKG